MSGFTNITGFAPPTSLSGFLGLLETASFRGVPFKVIAARVKKGRRWAIHEYPYVDGGWPEDLGRALRTYSFTAYLVGDLVPVMQNLLDNAIETEGPGLLIHPTLGALQVGLLSAGTAVHRDHMRVIEIELEFVEAGSSIFPLAVIATVVSVLAAADGALTASSTNFASVAVPAAAAGPAARSNVGPGWFEIVSLTETRTPYTRPSPPHRSAAGTARHCRCSPVRDGPCGPPRCGSLRSASYRPSMTAAARRP